MKFFAGMTNKDVADSLGISERTVDRHWMFARSWLFHKIEDL
jgi:FixJ family two-component response regulator